MISEIDTISIIRYLEKDEIGKAKDALVGFSPDSLFEKGYRHALEGLVASYENKERDSLFLNLLSGTALDETCGAEIETCKERVVQTFRSEHEIGYEHAWEFVLKYYNGTAKTGLDKYTE